MVLDHGLIIDKTNKVNKEILIQIEDYIYEMKKYKNSNFFIATDNDNIFLKLKEIFNNKVFKYDKKLFENNIDFKNNNIIEDFIELLLLSKNNILIHIKISSFYQIGHLYSSKYQKII